MTTSHDNPTPNDRPFIRTLDELELELHDLCRRLTQSSTLREAGTQLQQILTSGALGTIRRAVTAADEHYQSSDTQTVREAKRYRWIRDPRRSHALVGNIIDNSGKAERLSEFALDRAVDLSLPDGEQAPSVLDVMSNDTAWTIATDILGVSRDTVNRQVVTIDTRAGAGEFARSVLDAAIVAARKESQENASAMPPFFMQRYVDEGEAGYVGEEWIASAAKDDDRLEYSRPQSAQPNQIKWAGLFDAGGNLKRAYLLTRNDMNRTQLTLVDAITPLHHLDSGATSVTRLTAVAAALRALSDDQRIDLFGQFCKACGCNDPQCQCWNDE